MITDTSGLTNRLVLDEHFEKICTLLTEIRDALKEQGKNIHEATKP